MSLIREKILYSKDKLEEFEPDFGNHANFGEYILSFLNTEPDRSDEVWVVNAGYDLTGVNRSGCGKVLRKYGELEPMSRSVGKALAGLGVKRGSIVQVSINL